MSYTTRKECLKIFSVDFSRSSNFSNYEDKRIPLQVFKHSVSEYYFGHHKIGQHCHDMMNMIKLTWYDNLLTEVHDFGYFIHIQRNFIGWITSI